MDVVRYNVNNVPLKVKNIMKILFQVALLLFVQVAILTSQELKPNVTVNMEFLPQDQRVSLQTLQNDLTQYLKNQRYMDAWEGDPIPFDIQVFITGKQGNNYQARLVLNTSRVIDGGGTSPMLRIIDQEWSFPYQMNANITYQPNRYDPFSSIIDFYALMAIGYELDSYGQLDGSKAFSKMSQIANIASSNNALGFPQTSDPGIINKFTIANELNNIRFEDLRKEIYYYHVDGMDSLKYDRTIALKNLETSISSLAHFKRNKLSGNSALLQLLFDAKATELVDLFTGYEQKDIFNKLLYLDPSNGTRYRAASEKK